MKLQILNSTIEDINEIFTLYKVATDYQKIKFPENQWPLFERSLIETEIIELRQWKIIINNTIVCVWATTFSDPEIWEERNIDPSVYIHRIATNPNFRGHNFVVDIVKWATAHAKIQNKIYIRMDTCGYNKRLIDHYVSCGFIFLGIEKLKNTHNLPTHYIDADVCFFEIKLKRD